MKEGVSQSSLSEDQGAFGGSNVCLFGPEVVAGSLVLVLVCLPAVREREQVGVEEALAACKPGKEATLPAVASSLVAWQLQLGL